MYGAASGLLTYGVPPGAAYPPTSLYPYGVTPYGAPYGMAPSDFEDDNESSNETTIIKDISKEMMEKGEIPDEGRLVKLLPSKKLLFGLLICLLAPLLLFIEVYWVRVMWIRYAYPDLSDAFAAWGFLWVAATGCMAYGGVPWPLSLAFGGLTRKMNLKDPRLHSLLFVSCLGAWLLAFHAGDVTFQMYTQPYYNLLRFGTHKEVNPRQSASGSVMDAGIIQFTKNATLDLNHSMSFRSDDVYCVSPITTKGSKATEPPADGCQVFWAVGVNCCHPGEFQCGEYNNPAAHSGVRVMNEPQRDFFLLAVRKAEAAFNLKTCQPTFVHWLEKPSHETSAMHDDYIKAFCSGVLQYLCLQMVLIVVLIATAAYLKM